MSEPTSRRDRIMGEPIGSPALTRNAPGLSNTFSLLVDHMQHATDEARAAGLHGIAAELDAHRDAVAGLALRLWGERRCQR